MSSDISIRGVKDWEDLPEFLQVLFGSSAGDITDRTVALPGDEAM